MAFARVTRGIALPPPCPRTTGTPGRDRHTDRRLRSAGLMLGAQLASFGYATTIIDAKAGPIAVGEADGVSVAHWRFLRASDSATGCWKKPMSCVP